MARLTDAAVKATKATSTTRDIYDEGEAGLCLRVQPSGRKGWGLRIRIDGRQRRFDLGEYGSDGRGVSLAEARQKAAAMKKAAARGDDPTNVLRPPSSDAPAVSEAIAVYIET